jgi:hypothetical protein
MMKSRTTPGASIEKTPKGYLMKIPAGDSSAYRFAQIDDYFGLPRRKFPHHSLTLSLRARTSSFPSPEHGASGCGTIPSACRLGLGRIVWPPRPAQRGMVLRGVAGQSSFVQRQTRTGISRAKFPFAKISSSADTNGFGISLFRAKATRNCWARSSTRTHPLSGWIQLNGMATGWSGVRSRVAWYVDDVRVFESPVSPNPPLGLVIWIDNQFAAFTPEGKISFGVLEGDEEWLEIEDL